jgi:hypothetical protein
MVSNEKHDKTYGHCCVTFINSFVPIYSDCYNEKNCHHTQEMNLKPYSSMVFHVAKFEKKPCFMFFFKIVIKIIPNWNLQMVKL